MTFTKNQQDRILHIWEESDIRIGTSPSAISFSATAKKEDGHLIDTRAKISTTYLGGLTRYRCELSQCHMYRDNKKITYKDSDMVATFDEAIRFVGLQRKPEQLPEPLATGFALLEPAGGIILMRALEPFEFKGHHYKQSDLISASQEETTEIQTPILLATETYEDLDDIYGIEEHRDKQKRRLAIFRNISTSKAINRFGLGSLKKVKRDIIGCRIQTATEIRDAVKEAIYTDTADKKV